MGKRIGAVAAEDLPEDALATGLHWLTLAGEGAGLPDYREAVFLTLLEMVASGWTVCLSPPTATDIRCGDSSASPSSGHSMSLEALARLRRRGGNSE